MQFGLFGAAQAQRGGPDVDSAAGFRDYIEYVIEAEALGYQSAFIVEHHFTGFGQVSATLNLLTWIGARTRTLWLGTAVIVLPWHNPVLLAEQAATVDLLSGGRLDFGIGKGYRHNEFVGFRIPMEEAEPRFEEAIDIITKAWTSNERFGFHGRYRSAAWRDADTICCWTSLPRWRRPEGGLPSIVRRWRSAASGSMRRGSVWRAPSTWRGATRRRRRLWIAGLRRNRGCTRSRSGRMAATRPVSWRSPTRARLKHDEFRF
jgi:alkanesulfonate monooxygenase SsuD/methylene tetrahydromethanopterin reductase-like flavin-dependent oxidoreductase (luciferase family)